MLYIAIGILGATVMPHNLYLHSSVVQTRNYARTVEGKREAIKFFQIDSASTISARRLAEGNESELVKWRLRTRAGASASDASRTAVSGVLPVAPATMDSRATHPTSGLTAFMSETTVARRSCFTCVNLSAKRPPECSHRTAHFLGRY